ncbi:hypothetical protein M271_11915 [Streptomyces rapamycinicus NRRL 5491]|uniref:SMP-30/Gluconolactonase/LRE-like region domain-containing protein n=2 Tax=Streptomyces rapamycinicus TaxID=1226757 RepID=A0A0A0NHX4_STRRN|nr:hypothetical protein M271_11915 [Streptomyces rapamycinicus NRRL 5491]RLV73884.1 hypothetical protein D3C57_131700 [Streptomyces rapamycinicus NRRL 5491]
MSDINPRDQLNHERVPFAPVPAETITEWEPGTFLENLAPFPPGGWLVTVPSHRRIDLVTGDGRRSTFAELASVPTGIVTDRDGAWVISGTIGEPGWCLDRVRQGEVTHACDLPQLRFGNGMARDGRRLLIADSALGTVLAVDLDTRRAAQWIHHELFTPLEQAVGVPGINGITVAGDYVFLANSARALLLRVPAAATDTTHLEIVAERLFADDFAVHDDGTLYLATHIFDSVLRLTPGGRRTEIARADQGVETCTSVAIDPANPDTLWVTAAGERFGSGGRDKPARLIRLKTNPSAVPTGTSGSS